MPPSKVKDQHLQVTFTLDNEKEFKRYVNLLGHPGHVILRSFLVGSFQGLGFVLGSAALLTLFGFFWHQMVDHIPFLHNLSQALDLWIKATLEARS